jgi:hypothetical protein
VAWGGRNDLVAYATGTWDQLCVLDQQGRIYCAGISYADTPVLQDPQGSAHSRFWVSPGGGVQADDTTLLRADQSRTECKVTTQGLQCTGVSAPFGNPGSVVMGGGISPFQSVSQGLPLLGFSACWLESTGDVTCEFRSLFSGGPGPSSGSMRVFPGRVALALATQYYTNQICAVFADASVECVRVTINTQTAVVGPSAPAGSAMIGCP